MMMHPCNVIFDDGRLWWHLANKSPPFLSQLRPTLSSLFVFVYLLSYRPGRPGKWVSSVIWQLFRLSSCACVFVCCVNFMRCVSVVLSRSDCNCLTQNGKRGPFLHINFVNFKESNLLLLISCASGNVVKNDLLQHKRILFREFLHNQQAINFGASSTCAMTEKNRFRTDDFLEKLREVVKKKTDILRSGWP